MSLRTLLDFPAAGGGSAVTYTTLTVYNTNKDTANNGGFCCLWTVPAGVTWAAIELWGGGGGGSGACCCMSGWPGGAGSYARKIIPVAEGATYRICAAGSTVCSQSCCLGCPGNPSYVYNEGAAINVICASGGQRGCARCNFMVGCDRQGCTQYQCGSFCGSFGICGAAGSAKGSPMCSGSMYQYMPSAPFTMAGNRVSKDACSGFCGGCCVGGYAAWPGGGGATSVSHTTGGGYCGAAGAGGLVNVFYGSAV
jgi:hypothetical protein